MSFEADFKAHLQADPALVALVADRIHPGVVPEGSPLPVVTYTHVLGQPEICLDGFTSGVTRYAMQVDCWALTYDEATALALAVRDRLNTDASNFATALTEFPAFDDYEPQTKRYRRSLGCACRFKE
jgi:hypothetical protein